MDLDFYKNKKVLITGHTGFKGAWLTRILLEAGADICGYSLEPPTVPNLFSVAGLEGIRDIRGDVRDLDHLKQTFDEFGPEIVFHLAAQPIVKESYRNPVYTYETNVIGTVNVLECIRLSESARSAVIITTDKVYKNNEWFWGYRENELLDGFDPYSNSKSCADLAVHCYRDSFFKEEGPAVSVARAGNVIGGGDFAADRIIPDCIRALEKALADGTDNGTIVVRNPYSTRPYQHVLEPLSAYLLIAEKQWNDRSLASDYNVGPDDADCLTTGDLVTLFCKEWNERRGSLPEASWESRAEQDAPHEADFLKLDSTKIKSRLGWQPKWHIDECIEKTVIFYHKYLKERKSMVDEMDSEIREFFK